MTTIDNFTGRYAFLGTCYEVKIEYNGYTYKSCESAYQAQKCLSRRNEFCNLSPNQAMELGKQVSLRNDWEIVKGQIMMEICMNKFRVYPLLATKLLATENAQLVYVNDCADTIWGVCNGVGKNRLGKILMEIRRMLQEERDLQHDPVKKSNWNLFNCYVNSNTIKEYWKQIDFRPNFLQKAYIIWQDYNQSVDVKLWEFEQLAKDYPHCTFTSGSKTHMFEWFLQDYVEFQKQLIAEYILQDEKVVYFCETYYKHNKSRITCNEPFKTEAEAIASAEENWEEGEPYPDYIYITRKQKYSYDAIKVVYEGDKNGNIFMIEIAKTLLTEQQNQLLAVWNNMKLHFPLPFEKYNFVEYRTSPFHSKKVNPFILVDLQWWAYEKNQKQGLPQPDDSCYPSMWAKGVFAYPDGSTEVKCFPNFLNLEICSKQMTAEQQKVLDVIKKVDNL